MTRWSSHPGETPGRGPVGRERGMARCPEAGGGEDFPGQGLHAWRARCTTARRLDLAETRRREAAAARR